MWLHGILHRYEGDLTNAKAWYNGLDESKLVECPVYSAPVNRSTISSSNENGDKKGEDEGDPNSDPAHFHAFLLIDQVGLTYRGFHPPGLRKAYGDKTLSFPSSSPTESDLEAEEKRLLENTAEGKKEIDKKCWEELTWLLEKLVGMYGWKEGVDGTEGYTESTEQQKEVSRKMVGGGEGIRKF